jgi:hypothetical protein
VARATDGAIWKTKPVVLLKTLPLRIRTHISLMGCNIPGPFLPAARLFVRIIIPGIKMAERIIRIKLSMSDKV